MNAEPPQPQPADEQAIGDSAPHEATSQVPPVHEPVPQPQAPHEAAGEQPRSGPIFWGAIVLAVCVYVAAQVFAPGRIDATAFIIGSVLGLGVLLLAVGAAVLVRNRRGR